MGKVFSPEEIRAEQVPEEGAHYNAARFIMERLFNDSVGTVLSPNGIRAGMIHGSATHGTANIRSDLDVLATYQLSKNNDPLRVMHDVFEEVQTKFQVPVESNVLSIEDVSSRTHKIDPLFLRSLLQAQENSEFSWNWPATYIALGFKEQDFTHAALLQTVWRYVGAKNASFAKALAIDSEEHYLRVQRALELPKNLGRKVLGMLDEGFVASTTPTEDIIGGLNRFIKDCADNEYSASSAEDMSDGIAILTEQDKIYSELLSDTLSGQKSLEQYERQLYTESRFALSVALSVGNSMSNLLVNYQRQLNERESSDINGQLELFTVEDYWAAQEYDPY